MTEVKETKETRRREGEIISPVAILDFSFEDDVVLLDEEWKFKSLGVVLLCF